jgi:RimJ/RimL family protein N-acetyltransferase
MSDVRDKDHWPLHRSPPRFDLAFETANYLVRVLTPDDASDRWASWFSDPHVAYMINANDTRWVKETVVKYIKQFDQRAEVLLGIFVRESRVLVGINTFKINYLTRQALMSTLIGDAEYRHKGVLSEIEPPLYDHMFDRLRMKMILATALARNNIVINRMLRRGWKQDQTLPRHVKSSSDDTMLDLCLFSLTREAYRAWKRTSHKGG